MADSPASGRISDPNTDPWAVAAAIALSQESALAVSATRLGKSAAAPLKSLSRAAEEAVHGEGPTAGIEPSRPRPVRRIPEDQILKPAPRAMSPDKTAAREPNILKEKAGARLDLRG